MDKKDYAVECFGKGFNCSQAVFSTFCEDFGLDKKVALKIANSFGAGMGYNGEACGAVSGAFMTIGLKYGQYEEGDRPTKEKTYALVKEFTTRFKEINGTINCTKLIEYDLSDEKQLLAARQSDVFRTKCPRYIKDAVGILEDILSRDD